MSADGELNEVLADDFDDLELTSAPISNAGPNYVAGDWTVNHIPAPFSLEARLPLATKHGQKESDTLYYVRIAGFWQMGIFMLFSMCFVFGLLFPR